MAFSIGAAFEDFCGALRFPDKTLDRIQTRYHSITRRINSDYWGIISDTKNSLYVGSYGRDTEMFASDIDMLICLPYETYKKFNAYSTNGQSALLQEVRKSIEKTYPNTSVKADGQIISIPFTDGLSFEVLPAFLNDDDSYTFANTNNGGSWRITDPKAEISAVNSRNNRYNHNLKRLCKMARAWKDENAVDISGVLIDILAYHFIDSWEYHDKSFLYYDWMTRDFFEYVSNVPTSQYKWQVMGSGRYITCFGSFQNDAEKAYEKAVEAIGKEKDYPAIANQLWRGIYGGKFPIL